MRKTNRAAVAILLTLAIACASANKVAFVTVGSTVKTVDLAMRTWAAYVVSGNVQPGQEMQVKLAYDHYHAVAHAARTTLEATNEAPTPAQFAEAAMAIIRLVEQFTGKKVPVQP